MTRWLAVGFGCASYVTPVDAIAAAVPVLTASFELGRVARVATIDRLLALATARAVAEALEAELVTFDAAALDRVDVPTPSRYVRERMGTRSVAEAAALLAAPGGRLAMPKRVSAGSITLAVVEAGADGDVAR